MISSPYLALTHRIQQFCFAWQLILIKQQIITNAATLGFYNVQFNFNSVSFHPIFIYRVPHSSVATSIQSLGKQFISLTPCQLVYRGFRPSGNFKFAILGSCQQAEQPPAIHMQLPLPHHTFPALCHNGIFPHCPGSYIMFIVIDYIIHRIDSQSDMILS